MNRAVREVTLCVLILMAASIAGAAEPLVLAHAHNDYLHERPLYDALAHGFCSVEADVCLVDENLLVAHAVAEVSDDRTLQSLYLDPLRKRVAENGGRVYRDGPPLMLLIDIKTDGPATYAVLRDVLTQYGEMLTTVVEGKVKPGAVQVVISGNRPQAMMAAETTRFAGIDGRLSDLGTTKPKHLMPLISDRWTSHFRWRGNGVIPAAEREKLRTIVDEAHQSGRRIRFWATPEDEAVWKELAIAGVDLINVDDLPRLQRFLQGSD